ncbi:hypothetical protein [Agrococcus sp. DT81.2]|uniref:hypothetical protein n=1 Tax=Agrococcus sp. DT81.2 TaxID=3393414 RepID=UPI003CE4E1D5
MSMTAGDHVTSMKTGAEAPMFTPATTVLKPDQPPRPEAGASSRSTGGSDADRLV